MIEKRHHARTRMDFPVAFRPKDHEEFVQGTGRDISLGGLFVETDTPAAFGDAIIVRVRLRTASNTEQDFDLPGVVRWLRDGGMGVQFGLLGALETHAITELSAAR